MGLITLHTEHVKDYENQYSEFSEPLKYRLYPAHNFYEKEKLTLSKLAQGQKLGTRDHWALYK